VPSARAAAEPSRWRAQEGREGTVTTLLFKHAAAALTLTLALAALPGVALAQAGPGGQPPSGKSAPAGGQAVAGAQAPAGGQPPAGQKPQGAPGQEQKPASTPEKGEGLPAGVLARLNGRDITIQDYTAYLFASLGKSKLKEFIDRLLLEEEGTRLGVAVTPEEVEERVNAQIENTVRALYQNNMDRFVENLGRRGLTLDEHKQKLRQDTAYQLLEDKTILKNRKVTEEDIKARFEQMYGPGGQQQEIRHILISTRARPQRPGETRPPALTDQEARAKAEKVLKELQAGADFVQLVKAYSDDELTKANDGRIPVYRRGYHGPEFDEAVSRLTKEAPVSPVVRSPQGYHLIQLIDRKTTRLEDKREEILAYLKNQKPTVQEKNNFIKTLREKAKIEF
jgi:foldase protein PrsA